MKVGLTKLTGRKNNSVVNVLGNCVSESIDKSNVFRVRPVQANSLVSFLTKHTDETVSVFRDDDLSIVSKVEAITSGKSVGNEKLIVFVCPILVHSSELEIWNLCAKKLGVRAVIVTCKSEQKNFEHFEMVCRAIHVPLHLDCKFLEGISENRTFLAGLDAELQDATLVVSVGESSLASYQAVKARRTQQNRLAIWQNAPRPPHHLMSSRAFNGVPLPQIARERTIRKEVLKNCDVVLSFDKDSSTWAYLEDVSAQRLRRLSRGVNLGRFSQEFNASRRIKMRNNLGLPETDFIFLQSGPLELESGALDSVLAFKNLLQSCPSLSGQVKLVFCGTGSFCAEVRQSVVDLKLDEDVYFLNPHDSNTLQVLGNQLSNLLSLCDALIHNPISPVNGCPSRYLDCTYDVLCALASGITVVSNGNGWVGEWIGRFYKIFSSGSIHSQSKLMRESIEKQEKLTSIKKSIRTAFENELCMEKAVIELSAVFKGLMLNEVCEIQQEASKIFSQIERAIKSKQYIDAIHFINQAFQHPHLSDVQRASLFRHIADCFTKLGDYDNGMQNYIRAQELDPYCSKIFIGLGTVCLQTNNYNVAVPHFQKAVALAPGDDMANLGLGLAFEGLGELREALNWTVRACNLNIESTVAIYNLVKLSHDLEEYLEAEVILTRYVGLHPHDVNMIFTLGGIAFKTGRIELAEKLMENILVLDPMNSRAHGLLSQMQRRSGSRKMAS